MLICQVCGQTECKTSMHGREYYVTKHVCAYCEDSLDQELKRRNQEEGTNSTERPGIREGREDSDDENADRSEDEGEDSEDEGI